MSIALLEHQGTQTWPGWALLMRGRSPFGRSSRYLALITQTVLTRIGNVLSVDAVFIPAYDVPMPLSYHLTHWVLMTPYGDGDLDQHWLRRWLDAWASVSRMHKNGCSSWCECSFLITSNLFQFVSLFKFLSSFLFKDLASHHPRQLHHNNLKSINTWSQIRATILIHWADLAKQSPYLRLCQTPRNCQITPLGVNVHETYSMPSCERTVTGIDITL